MPTAKNKIAIADDHFFIFLLLLFFKVKIRLDFSLNGLTVYLDIGIKKNIHRLTRLLRNQRDIPSHTDQKLFRTKMGKVGVLQSRIFPSLRNIRNCKTPTLPILVRTSF